jgi:hypothetical protein
MFGEIILIGGLTLFSAVVEKILEELGKESTATALGLVTKGGLALYAIKEINSVVREVTKEFM